jgi:4-carboxymuconolactone decarboxylase
MTAREDLRRTGAEMKRRLGLADATGLEVLPGLANLTDEVVFGRVWSRPGLPLEERMLATLSALTSRQHLPQLAGFVSAALHIGMNPRLIQEVMLHCAMYSGMPTAENSLEVVSKVLAERGLPQPEADLEEADLDELSRMGEETMRALHGERAESGYAAPTSAAREIYGTAIQYLYGEVWNRPGISRRQRMICSVAAFTATQMAAQQRKFFRSAQNVGLSRTEILEIIIQTGPYSGFPPALNAITIAEEVLD